MMLIGILSTTGQIINETGIYLDVVDSYIILNENLSSASVNITIDTWIEQIPSSKTIDLTLILPERIKDLQLIIGKQKNSKKTWLSKAELERSNNNPTAQIRIPVNNLGNQQNFTLAIQYEVLLESRSVDLSLHASELLRNILYHLSPSQEPIPISQANVWLIYNNQKLRVFADKTASENHLSGSDLVASNPILPTKSINAKTNYTRLLWHTSKPSLSLPFYLNAIVQSGEFDDKTWTEIKIRLDSLEQKIQELDKFVLQSQKDLDYLYQKTDDLTRNQLETNEFVQKLSNR